MKKDNPTTRFLIANGIYIVLVLIIIYFAVSTTGFFTYKNLINIPQQVAYYIIIAVGMTMVIITGGIDISVGCVVALTGVLFALFVQNFHLAIPLAIVLALLCGSTCGATTGLFVTRFKVPPFIATLAMFTIARGLARIFSHNTKIFIGSEAIVPFNKFVMSFKILGIPALVLLMLAIVVIFGLLLMKTRFGRYVLATGGNEEAARLSGINTNRVKFIVYTICAFLAAVVGILVACEFTNGDAERGMMWELEAIAACVVGGTSLMGGKGNIFKTLLGALLIGVLNNGLQVKGLDPNMIYVIKGAIILGAVVVDQIKSK